MSGNPRSSDKWALANTANLFCSTKLGDHRSHNLKSSFAAIMPSFRRGINEAQLPTADSYRVQFNVGYLVGTEIIPIPLIATSIEELLDSACHFNLGSLNSTHTIFLSARIQLAVYLHIF